MPQADYKHSRRHAGGGGSQEASGNQSQPWPTASLNHAFSAGRPADSAPGRLRRWESSPVGQWRSRERMTAGRSHAVGDEMAGVGRPASSGICGPTADDRPTGSTWVRWCRVAPRRLCCRAFHVKHLHRECLPCPWFDRLAGEVTTSRLAYVPRTVEKFRRSRGRGVCQYWGPSLPSADRSAPARGPESQSPRRIGDPLLPERDAAGRNPPRIRTNRTREAHPQKAQATRDDANARGGQSQRSRPRRRFLPRPQAIDLSEQAQAEFCPSLSAAIFDRTSASPPRGATRPHR